MKAKTIVVKLGTSMLASGTKYLDSAHMIEVVRVIANLVQAGYQVVVVSSGAMAAGRQALNFPKVPKTLAYKQMFASVGQNYLMHRWEQLFEIYNLKIGQLLLTMADLESRERFLNVKDALGALLSMGIIPIINENDAVSTKEIRVGDNDNLSARAAILAEADILVLLTDQKGLYTADPRSHQDAKLIAEVKEITPEIKALAGCSVSGLGTGGMATKLQAAEIATRSGVDVIIASGANPSILLDIVKGDFEGTRICAQNTPLEAKKAWILAGTMPQGTLVIDEGTVDALAKKGSSLLPKGIIKVSGEFLRGDAVNITDSNDKVIAIGITRYSSAELQQIARHNSADIEQILGYERGSVAVHRDDLVMI